MKNISKIYKKKSFILSVLVFGYFLSILSIPVLAQEVETGESDSIVSINNTAIFSFNDRYTPYNPRLYMDVSVSGAFNKGDLTCDFNLTLNNKTTYVGIAFSYGTSSTTINIINTSSTIVVNIEVYLTTTQHNIVNLSINEMINASPLYLVENNAVSTYLTVLYETDFAMGTNTISDQSFNTREEFYDYFSDKVTFGILHCNSSNIKINNLYVTAVGLPSDASGLTIIIIVIEVSTITGIAIRIKRKRSKS